MDLKSYKVKLRLVVDPQNLVVCFHYRLLASLVEILLLNSTDSRTVENLGELELHFGATKPLKSIETHGDWIITWRITFQVTKFIFLHREKELEEYTEYTSSSFTSLHSIKPFGTTVPTLPVVADYNMMWSIVITGKY
jgi:hypothetical protein